MEIENYDVAKEYVVLSKIDSVGSQIKFYKDGYWYKYDSAGVEGLAEQLVSDFLSCTNITDFVRYERCEINHRLGCRSKSFLNENERLITFDSIYRNISCGESLSEKMGELQFADARLSFLLDFMKDTTGLDATEYLYHNLTLDMIIRNPDRHFRNLAIIETGEGGFRFAPIFDNGQGLTANFNITPPDLELEEKENLLCGATISGSFDTQYQAIREIYQGEPLKIDYEMLTALLNEKYPENSVAKEYLTMSVEKYKLLFPAL